MLDKLETNKHIIYRDGRVYSKLNKRYLRWVPNTRGYPRIQMSTRKHTLLHRLIAMLFVHNPNPKIKTEVNHKDYDVTNPHADNLEWVTPEENREHRKLKPWPKSSPSGDCPF